MEQNQEKTVLNSKDEIIAVVGGHNVYDYAMRRFLETGKCGRYYGYNFSDFYATVLRLRDNNYEIEPQLLYSLEQKFNNTYDRDYASEAMYVTLWAMNELYNAKDNEVLINPNEQEFNITKVIYDKCYVAKSYVQKTVNVDFGEDGIVPVVKRFARYVLTESGKRAYENEFKPLAEKVLGKHLRAMGMVG